MPSAERGVAGALLAADLVVVGQRPQLDAVGRGACGEGFGFERAVGDGRVAVQVGIGQMTTAVARGGGGHAAIVPAWRNLVKRRCNALGALRCGRRRRPRLYRPNSRIDPCAFRIPIPGRRRCCWRARRPPHMRQAEPAGQTRSSSPARSPSATRRTRRTPSAAIDARRCASSGPMVNLSEAMARVPGLVVANRNNYAQDLQISSRGFGARAGFGVRGVRLYTDGIPATMPDGQGQVSPLRPRRRAAHRGAARAVLGAVRQQLGRRDRAVQRAGAHGARSRPASTSAASACGRRALARRRRWAAASNLRVGASRLEIDGFRPHSAAQRDARQRAPGLAGRARHA